MVEMQCTCSQVCTPFLVVFITCIYMSSRQFVYCHFSISVHLNEIVSKAKSVALKNLKKSPIATDSLMETDWSIIEASAGKAAPTNLDVPR